MKPGAIIEYIDDQKIICAVVLEVRQNRLRILSEYNREVSLSTNRPSHINHAVLDLSVGRDQLVNNLQSLSKDRQTLTPRVDIKGLWEVLQVEQKWIDLATITELCFPGRSDADHQSAVMRALFYSRSFFKFNHDRFFPYTPQQVRQSLNKVIDKERQQHLLDIGQRWLRAVLGQNAPPSESLPYQRKLIDLIKSFVLYEKDCPQHALAKSIMDAADVQSTDALFRVLVQLGEFDPHENLDLTRLQTPVAFPRAVVSAANRLTPFNSTSTDAEQRRDLTFLTTLTIDGQSTLDFDDALSLQTEPNGYRLGVHIADVGFHVAKASRIDGEAAQRASSIYTPDLKIPMLPEILAENLCSLKAHAVRPTMTLLMHLTRMGKLQHYEVFPSYIKVSRQLTYFEVNQTIGQSQTLKQLLFLADCFRTQRLDARAVHINLPEISVRVFTDHSVSVHRNDRESPSRKLVSEIMIKANQTMAKALSNNGLPAIFRAQAEPKERLFTGIEESLVTNCLQRRLLNRFALDHQPAPHAGLGVDAYVTATSPIRKYVDLVTQRQLRALCGLETPYSAAEIDHIIDTLQTPMANVGRIQTRRQRYWILTHLSSRVGQRIEALVLMKRRHHYQLLLPDFMVECKLLIGQHGKLQPGETIWVTLQFVSARNDILTVFYN